MRVLVVYRMAIFVIAILVCSVCIDMAASTHTHVCECASPMQGLMIVLMTTYRMSGVRSSGVPFIFWLVMSLYGAVKLRTLVLLSEDNVCRVSVCIYHYTTAVCE